MKKTVDHFNLSVDELLETNENGYTKEENLLFDSGLEVIFLDDEKEYQEELQGIKRHMGLKGYESLEMIKTINERIAVVLK